jgi:hypothetical protein
MAKARRPAAPRKRSAENTSRPADCPAAEEAFRRAAVERGEAVPKGKDGRLPPGATFELEGYDEKGTPIIKRKRFSIG